MSIIGAMMMLKYVEIRLSSMNEGDMLDLHGNYAAMVCC